MFNEQIELNENASAFIEAVKKEYQQVTGKELSDQNVISIAIEALRERSEKYGLNLLVKAVNRSGVLNKE